jgi:hypothetical protein
VVRFSKNANFWDWVKDTYTEAELKRLATETTDTSLIALYDPFGDRSWAQQQQDQHVRRKTVKRLLKRYGDEIWSACLGVGGYDPDKGVVGLQCLAKLDLAFQVYNQFTFEEFLVRNALRRAAQQIFSSQHRA